MIIIWVTIVKGRNNQMYSKIISGRKRAIKNKFKLTRLSAK